MAKPRFAGLPGQICFGRESWLGASIGPKVSSIGSCGSEVSRACAVAGETQPAQSYGDLKFQVAVPESWAPVLAKFPELGASQVP